MNTDMHEQTPGTEGCTVVNSSLPSFLSGSKPHLTRVVGPQELRLLSVVGIHASWSKMTELHLTQDVLIGFSSLGNLNIEHREWLKLSLINVAS